MRGRLFIVFLWQMLVLAANAQIQSSKPHVDFGYYGFEAEVGITSFFGDIDEGPAEGGVFKNNTAWQLSAHRLFNNQMKLSGNICFGKMSGDKQRGINGKTYHLYFKNTFIQYTFNFAVNFVAFVTQNPSCRIMVFGGLGIGLIDFRTTLYNGTDNSVVQAFGAEGENSTTEFALPLTFELLYHVSNSSAVCFKTTLSSVDTDKLDGLSGNNNRDYYNYLSLGYTFKLPVKRKGGILSKGAK